MTNSETNQNSIFTIIWKSFVALLVASIAAGAIIGPSIILFFASSSSTALNNDTNIALILCLYAATGAVGGYVYFLMNKKLNNF